MKTENGSDVGASKVAHGEDVILPMENCRRCKLYREFIMTNESIYMKICENKLGMRYLDCYLFAPDCIEDLLEETE